MVPQTKNHLAQNVHSAEAGNPVLKVERYRTDSLLFLILSGERKEHTGFGPWVAFSEASFVNKWWLSALMIVGMYVANWSTSKKHYTSSVLCTQPLKMTLIFTMRPKPSTLELPCPYESCWVTVYYILNNIYKVSFHIWHNWNLSLISIHICYLLWHCLFNESYIISILVICMIFVSALKLELEE